MGLGFFLRRNYVYNPKPPQDSMILDPALKMDVGYMIADLRKIFKNAEDFEAFVEVIKETVGEFLMDVYASPEKNVTVETLLLQLKKIAERRFDEA